MPSEHEAYKRVEPISGSETRKVDLSPSGGAGEEGPSKVKFDEAVAHADPSKVQVREVSLPPEPAVTEAKKPSLMEVATKVTQQPTQVTPTPKDLGAQASDLRRQIERPRAVLIAEMQQNPTVVENIGVYAPDDVAKATGHMEHIDRGLRDVSQMTTSVEVGTSLPPVDEKSPAVRFLSFLTESDKKLGGFVDEINSLKLGEGRLSPETLFAVQIKLGFVQTELEFFTATLNKALESTKTIFNIQI
jgi:hypothetical protein